jgi:AAA+ superfamily predicted ATPase
MFADCLSPTDAATPIRLERAVLESVGQRAVVAAQSLDLDEYEQLGLCKRELLDRPRSVSTDQWGGEDQDRLFTSFEQAYWRVHWRDMVLHVLMSSWQAGYCSDSRYWVVADRVEVAKEFILDVARRTNDPGDSILVFHGGYWQRSRELFEATRLASFDDLVLAGTLKDAIRADFQKFLAARERYESLGLAWRRGALFLGPPGNGKTHCVRALVRELGVPSLYVQSLRSQHYTSEQLLKTVFDRARKLRPVILIFEDLDALVTEENRSFFLNQLDGFEKNLGMVVLATSNHPERIDPALLDRPSRFDRKYHFGLPGADERRSFLALWQARLEAETGWSPGSLAGLVERTHGFSFAYLKELVVSGLLSWMTDQQGAFADRLGAQTEELRSQMETAVRSYVSPTATDVVAE